jgi:hypothetical protein
MIKLEKSKKNNSELNKFNIKIAGDKKNKIAQNAKDLQEEQEHIEKIKKEINNINMEIQKYNYQNDVQETEIEFEINL